VPLGATDTPPASCRLVYLAKPLVQFPMVLMQSREALFVVQRMVQGHEGEINLQLRVALQQSFQNCGDHAHFRQRPEPGQDPLDLVK